MRQQLLKYFLLLLGSLLILQLSSCVYLNTFYNAKRYFKEGVKENKDNETGQPRTANYQKAVTSAARIIEYYPNSRYVDDAIMIIGKAYYEMRNYPGAKRKFDELMTNYPNSELIHEAKVYSAKTLIALRQDDEGIALLNALWVDESTPPDIRIKGQKTLADYFYDKKNYHQALSEYNKILETSKNKVERADVCFQIGECYYILGEFEQAQQFYKLVLNEKPTRKRQFEAIFKDALARKEQQDLVGALTIFEDILKTEMYFPYYERVHLAKADILAELQRTEEAEALYKRTIELYPRTKTSAEAAYHLGLIYLYDLNDFTKAEEYLSKVRNEQPQSQFVDTAQVKINDLRQMTALNTTIDSLTAEIDTLNFRLSWIAEHPGGIVADTSQPDPTLQLPPDSLRQLEGPQSLLQPSPTNPEQPSLPGINDFGSRRQLEGELPGNFPSHLQPGQEPLDRYGMEPQLPGSPAPGMPRRRAMVALPTDSTTVYEWLARDRIALAEQRFRLAEHLWLQFDNLDSARVLLTDLAEHAEAPDVKARAMLSLYHMAEITSADTTGSDSLLRCVHAEFPETEYDRWVRIKLGLDPLPEKVDSVAQLFHQAEELWMSQDNPEAAIEKYQEVRKNYPSTDWAPKAVYATAYIEEHILQDIPAALAAYDSLLAWYPQSPYQQIAQKKISPPPPEIPDTIAAPQDTTSGVIAEIALEPAPPGSGPPEMVGGDEALQNAIHQNHLYPPVALEAGISGEVTVSFIIAADGKVRDFRIESEEPAGFDFGEMAIQALKGMSFKPKYQNGQYEESPFARQVRFSP